jgi:hypothetical protein
MQYVDGEVALASSLYLGPLWKEAGFAVSDGQA